MNKRILIAALALVLAIAAGGAAYAYLHNIQRRAYHNAALVPVYRVRKAIAAGTPASVLLAQGLVARASIPNQFRPTDAVTALSSLQGEQATAAISPGQVLDGSQFESTATATASTPAAVIPRGDVAISVSVDSVHGVAGLIQPGNHVDILVETGGSAGAEHFLYQDVPVLAVGSTTVSSSATQTASATSGSTTTTTTPASSSGLITFAVPPQAAQRIALAESGGAGVTGQLYLALVPGTGGKAVPYPSINAGNLIPVKPTP